MALWREKSRENETEMASTTFPSGSRALEIPAREISPASRVYVRPRRVIPTAETSRIRIILLARTPKHLLRLNVPWNGMVVPADGNQHRRKFQRDLSVTRRRSPFANGTSVRCANYSPRRIYLGREDTDGPGKGTPRNLSLDSFLPAPSVLIGLSDSDILSSRASESRKIASPETYHRHPSFFSSKVL